MLAGHVVLLGDSIFDNAAYVGPGPDVVTQLRAALPDGWQATLRAVDGATTAGLTDQLARVPRDATHLVVSIGGNDALGHSDLLGLPATSSAEVLYEFARRIDAFEQAYRAALAPVVATGLPVTVCTIYNGALEPATARIARIGLAVFNDAILRIAAAQRVDVIELRAVCTEPADYANPIEPSSRGGAKIATAIATAVAGEATARAGRLWGAFA